jgi:hypothetical protein
MIQPVYIKDEAEESCRVHDMVLDLIRSLSNEQNFVTILDGIQHCTPNSQSKIQRLSLQSGIEDTSFSQLATTRMSQVRSVTLFQPAANVMPSLSSFGVLRVLALEGCEMPKSWYEINLKYIGDLLHLRYLGLHCSSIEELPVDIGKLQHLQMLDISGSRIDELPSSVIMLSHLLGLRIEWYTEMPVGMGKLISLQELTCLHVGNSQDIAKELGYLSELRVLEVVWGECDGSLEKSMVESLGNLRKLQTLRIGYCLCGEPALISMDGWVPSPQLRRFSSWSIFPALPAWINSSSLPLLSSLHITVVELQQGDFHAIGSLPTLSYLTISARKGLFVDSAPEESFVVSGDAFPCMKECNFLEIEVLPSMFPRGTMPMVRDMYITLRASAIANAERNLEMGHLPSLEQVEVELSRNGASLDVVRELEAALRLAADAHPNRPSLLIRRFD